MHCSGAHLEISDALFEFNTCGNLGAGVLVSGGATGVISRTNFTGHVAGVSAAVASIKGASVSIDEAHITNGLSITPAAGQGRAGPAALMAFAGAMYVNRVFVFNMTGGGTGGAGGTWGGGRLDISRSSFKQVWFAHMRSSSQPPSHWSWPPFTHGYDGGGGRTGTLCSPRWLSRLRLRLRQHPRH